MRVLHYQQEGARVMVIHEPTAAREQEKLKGRIGQNVSHRTSNTETIILCSIEKMLGLGLGSTKSLHLEYGKSKDNFMMQSGDRRITERIGASFQGQNIRTLKLP